MISESLLSKCSFESNSDFHFKSGIGLGVDPPDEVNNDSFRSRALFAGREVSNHFTSFWLGVYEISGLPFGLIGGALGGAVGYLGGAVYKAGRHALGREAQTKPLSDYALNAALKGFDALSQVGRVVLAPATAALAFGFSVAGVVGAVLGTAFSVITAPVYKFLHDGQNKRLSDYVIDSAVIGANIGMVTAAVASLVAGVIFSEFITLYCLAGLLVPILCSMYVESDPTWLEGRRKKV